MELSRRSVARALPHLQMVWHALAVGFSDSRFAWWTGFVIFLRNEGLEEENELLVFLIEIHQLIEQELNQYRKANKVYEPFPSLFGLYTRPLALIVIWILMTSYFNLALDVYRQCQAEQYNILNITKMRGWKHGLLASLTYNIDLYHLKLKLDHWKSILS